MKFSCLSRKKLIFLLFSVFLTTSLFSGLLTNVKATLPPSLTSPSNGAYINDNTPTASWTPVILATEYHIQVALKDDFSTILGENYPTVASYTASPPLPDGLYYWRVRANAPSTGGWSGWSSVWSFRIDTVAPDAPTLVDPHNFEWINDNTPYFDWNPVAGCNVYDIKISVNYDLSSPIYETLLIGGTGITPFITFPDGLYYWGVAARDAINWGPYSTPWGVHIDTVPPAATTLVSPADGYISNSQVTLECSVASGANLYIFEIATDPAFGILDTVYSGGTTARTHTTNEADGFYYWRVKTKDSAQNIAYSATRTFTIDTIGPSAPTLVSPTHNTYTTDSTPYLDWSVPATAAGYQVQVDTSASFTTTVVDTTPSNSYYTTTTLADNTYYWRVRAKDSLDNWGSWTSTWSFIIDTTAPSAPTLVSPGNNLETNDNTPYLDWLEVGDASDYQVQVDTSDSFPSPIIDVGGLAVSYYQILSSLTDDVYFWRVRAVDLAGNIGAWSAIRSFTIDTAGPSAPSLVSPDDAEILTDTTPLLLWNSVTDGEEYQLQIDTAGTFVSFEYNITTSNTFYSIPVDLSDGTYYWRIRARDTAANWGSWSTIWSFTIDTVGPYISSPDNIEYEIGTTGNNFSWFPQDDNPSSYIVYLDGAILFSGTWNTSGEEIFIDVDGFGIGVYNFTLYFEDATGKNNTDTVFVSVTEVVIPEYGLTAHLILLPVFFIGILIIRKRRK